jgi:hypothetical protein
MHRYAFFFLLIAAAAVVVFIAFSLNGYNAVNPNLMAAPKTFMYPADAETWFQRQVEQDRGLGKIFSRERLNLYYPREPWSGRVKYRGVSYQGLIAVRNSSISIKVKKLAAAALSFSVFNPGNSRMFYRVTITCDNLKTTLFKEFIDKEALASKKINLAGYVDRPVEFVFETKGKGTGAWLNPRLTTPGKNPRVVAVIVLDTLRCDHTSLYGYKRATTPELDRLGRDSVVFRRAYSTTSWTLPAHVSLFSGKNLEEHGVVTPNDRIPDDIPLAAELFQRAGFVTAAFTGGGFVEDTFGFSRGFQLYSNVPGDTFSMNSAQRVFNHFKNYIDRFPGEDIFVFLHTYQVHAPYKAPRESIAKIDQHIGGNLKGVRGFIRSKREYHKALDDSDRRLLIDLYDAGIHYADQALVGNMVEFLKERGWYDDAVLAVLSDHGEEFYDHQSWEHGHTLYRELIKIPLVIKYPGSRKTGDEHGLASITDVPGIILEESGVHYDRRVFRAGVGKKNRVLPVLLPLSPIIPQFPPKIALVDNKHYFIFNVIDEEKIAFFDPLPPAARMRDMELYDAKDYLQRGNLYKQRRHVTDRFARLLEKYLTQIKGIKIEGFKGNNELTEKLKSLGYLGN